MKRKKKELSPYCMQRFGFLTVLDTYRKNGRTWAICVCSCGNRVETRLDSLKSNLCRSCGCLKKKNRKIIEFLNRNLEEVTHA